MIVDRNLIFSGSIGATGAITGQTVTGTNTSVVSTDALDTQGGTTPGQNIDLVKGEEMELVAQITTAFAGLTSLAFEYISADDGALTTNVTVLASTGPIPLANLTLGTQVNIPLNVPEPRALRRFVGVRYTIVGTGTAGAVFTSLMHRRDDLPKPYLQSGFAVL